MIGGFVSNVGSSNRRRLHESDTKQSTGKFYQNEYIYIVYYKTSATLSRNYANIFNFSGNRKGHMTVIQDPNQNHNLTFPHIEGLKDNYTDASHVMLTCISSNLKPAPRFEIPDF